jgi:hypothetical protein
MSGMTTPDHFFDFLTVRELDGGFAFSQPLAQIDELTTPGVDGKRYRESSHLFGPLRFETLVDCSNFKAAVDLGNLYRSAVGQYVLLNIQAGGSGFVFDDAYVSAVTVSPRAGQTTGADATAGNTAHLIAVWTVELSEFAASENE